MNGRTLLLLVMAVAIAAVMVIMVNNRNAPTQTVSGPKILVAAQTIAAGSFIRADKDLQWAEWPQASVSPSYLTPQANRIEDFNGAVARHDIAAGEPITATAVVRVNEGGFMSAVLTPGMRAVSIAVNSISANAGFVFPGDHVDLILTHKIPDGVLASETFLKDLRVLAVDQMLNNPDNKAVIPKTLTLEVTPKQAEMINVAISIGTISVSLRSLATQKAPTAAGAPDAPHDAPGNYSTNLDVSRLLDEKGSITTKVNVYHGSTNEQMNFQENSK
ncbi:MAG TPA: Flp pilus assembly protein CpaB [Rickettsiales bacterium]|nr:Flp pilus assembly protein CpaB [Rickettsiales bacterium]